MTEETLLTGGQETTQPAGEQQPGAAPQGNAPDAKPKGDAQPAGDGQPPQDGETPKEAAVPEKYEVQLPEGVALDDEIFGEFSEFAKGKKLSNEDVQKHVDFAVKLQGKWLKAQTDAWQQVQVDWVKAAKNDPEYGGAKFTENLVAANKVLSSLGEPELAGALKATGMANHPALFRALVKLSKQIAPDKFVAGGTPATVEKSLADRLFPDN